MEIVHNKVTEKRYIREENPMLYKSPGLQVHYHDVWYLRPLYVIQGYIKYVHWHDQHINECWLGCSNDALVWRYYCYRNQDFLKGVYQLCELMNKISMLRIKAFAWQNLKPGFDGLCSLWHLKHYLNYWRMVRISVL